MKVSSSSDFKIFIAYEDSGSPVAGIVPNVDRKVLYQHTITVWHALTGRALSSVLVLFIVRNLTANSTLEVGQVAWELVFVAFGKVVLSLLDDCLEGDEMAICLLRFVKIANPYCRRFEVERTALEVFMRASGMAAWGEANAMLHVEGRNQAVPTRSVCVGSCKQELLSCILRLLLEVECSGGHCRDKSDDVEKSVNRVTCLTRKRKAQSGFWAGTVVLPTHRKRLIALVSSL